MASSRSLTVPNPQFGSAGDGARRAASGGAGVGGVQGRFAIDTSLSDASSAFGDLTKVAEQISFERDAVKAVEAETKAILEGQKQLDALDPLAPDYNDRVKAVAADARRIALESSGITNSAVKDDLTKRMERHAGAFELNAQRMRKVAVSDEAIRVTKDSIDATSAKIRNDPANLALYSAEFATDLERIKVGMDPTKVPVATRMAADTFAEDQVRGYALKGNYGAAREALKTHAGSLKGSTSDTLSNFIDGKENKARADGDRFRNQTLAGVLVDINDKAAGNKDWVGDERQKIDTMKAQGAITPEGYLHAVSNLNQAEKVFKIETAKNQVALTNGSNGVLENQEQADRYFKQMVGPIPFGALATQGTNEQWERTANVGVAMAKEGRFIPNEMNNLLKNADEETNPQNAQRVGRAAMLADDMSEVAPRSLNGVGLQDSGTLAIVRAEAKRLIEQGVPKAEAYQQAAQTNMNKGPLTIQEEKDRVETARKAIAGMDLTAAATNALTTWTDRNVPFVKMPGMDAAMGQEWKRRYEDAFARTGDPSRAKAMADKGMTEIFGVSRVGSVGKAVPGLPEGVTPEAAAMNPAPAQLTSPRAVVTRRPIEKYMPPSARALEPDQQAVIIQNQIENGLKERGINLAKDPDFPALPAYRLLTDDRTENDLKNGTIVTLPDGKKERVFTPTYRIQVLRPNSQGSYDDVPGMGRFRPPTEAELLQDDTYRKFDAERITRDMGERQKYLENQTEIRNRQERIVRQPVPKVQPLVEPSRRPR
jgi:hypothetical protein